MAKHIWVANSPWNRAKERPSDCQRWIRQGHAFMAEGKLVFTEKFLESQRRQMAEANPIAFDDGTLRRWARAESGSAAPADYALNQDLIDGKMIVTSPAGIGVKQLLPVKFVGTIKGVTHRADKLTRRYQRRFRTIVLQTEPS